MRKLNNKGFAITTVIYGLSIMAMLLVAILMATMSINRSNNKQLSSSIEEELNRFSKTETSFGPLTESASSTVPAAQEYIVPEGQSGWYRIELWGTQGGGSGGYGAYTSGVIELKEGDILYFYVGKHQSSGGGRETDVRINPGKYADEKSYSTRIMAAAGGGTASSANGGTLYGYQASMNALGGYIDDKNYDIITTNNATNKTLVGYPSSYAKSTIEQTSTTSPTGSNGGGDGYYPSTKSTQGGISFIAGYAGSKAKVKNEVTNDTIYNYYELKFNEDTNAYYYDTSSTKAYYFVDGMMFAGVNEGDGKAKIERLVVKTEQTPSLPRQNQKLNNVRYIKDCLGTSNTTITWKRLEAIVNGRNVAKDKSFEAEQSRTGQKCKTIDLQANYNLDEIAVWHQDGIDFKDHTIEVSSNGSSWTFIKNHGNGTDLSETETVTGIRISAYQYDSTTTIPSAGNYYLIPVLSENKVVSANENAESDADQIGIYTINGYKRQRWSIELITNENINPNQGTQNEYKIVELARYKSLSIYADENIVKNKISANAAFNNYSRNEPQIWKITPVGNGTYTISTVVKPFDSTVASGNILAQTNKDIDDYNGIIIGKNNTKTQRFKLVAIEYSSE